MRTVAWDEGRPCIGIGRPVPPTAPDAELLRLGRQLAGSWSEEIRLGTVVETDPSPEVDAAHEAAMERSSAIVDKIEALAATTLAGLGVKALAVCWCEAGSLDEDIASTDYGSTDLRVLAAVRRELLAINKN